jgi:hypothetical protein
VDLQAGHDVDHREGLLREPADSRRPGDATRGGDPPDFLELYPPNLLDVTRGVGWCLAEAPVDAADPTVRAAPVAKVAVSATPFVGREALLVEISARFEGGWRVVALRGPVGVGETRAALEAAPPNPVSFRPSPWTASRPPPTPRSPCWPACSPRPTPAPPGPRREDRAAPGDRQR